MQHEQHQNLVGFIWNIANKLRGPYRPPQYRRVMLPLIVLRRFDLVLAENKPKVLAEKKRLEDKGITGPAIGKGFATVAEPTFLKMCQEINGKEYGRRRPASLDKMENQKIFKLALIAFAFRRYSYFFTLIKLNKERLRII